MVDMVGIGNEGILAVTDTEEEYPDKVQTGYQQGGEGQHHWIDVVGKRVADFAHLDVHETQQEAYGHAAGIAHEYLPVGIYGSACHPLH